MKVLIIDNLTQTSENIVRSGLQKSSRLDAQAFSMFHNTTLAYCGKINDSKYKYNHLVLNPIGAKDECLELNQSVKKSYIYVRKYLEKLKSIINSFDLIIAHCHSLSMINTINASQK